MNSARPASARSATVTAPALLWARLPLLMPSADHLARWFQVRADGTRAITLTAPTAPGKVVLRLELDDQAHLVALRDGAGRDLATVTWAGPAPVALTTGDTTPAQAIGELINYLPIFAFEGGQMHELDAQAVMDWATAGIGATALAARWNSPLLVDVNEHTLDAMLGHPDLLKSLEQIEDFRALAQNAQQIVTSTNNLKKAKREQGGELDPEQKREHTDTAKKRKEIREKLVLLKLGADTQNGTLNMHAAAAYLAGFDIEEHIRAMLPVYRHKRDLMLATMADHFPEGITWTHAQGGLFTWVTFPESLDAAAFQRDVLIPRAGVIIVPGAPFFTEDPAPAHHARMSFSGVPDDRLVAGISAMGALLREALR